MERKDQRRRMRCNQLFQRPVHSRLALDPVSTSRHLNQSTLDFLFFDQQESDQIFKIKKKKKKRVFHLEGRKKMGDEEDEIQTFSGRV